MNVTVHKYPLEVEDRQEVLMPKGAKLLHVDVQHGKPCLWALVDTEERMVRRMIYIHGTGHPIYTSHEYVGTFMLPDGDFVGHVFG